MFRLAIALLAPSERQVEENGLDWSCLIPPDLLPRPTSSKPPSYMAMAVAWQESILVDSTSGKYCSPLRSNTSWAKPHGAERMDALLLGL